MTENMEKEYRIHLINLIVADHLHYIDAKSLRESILANMVINGVPRLLDAETIELETEVFERYHTDMSDAEVVLNSTSDKAFKSWVMRQKINNFVGMIQKMPPEIEEVEILDADLYNMEEEI